MTAPDRPPEDRSAWQVIDLGNVPRLLGILAADFLLQNRVLPVRIEEDWVVIAHSGETDPQAIMELASLLQHRPRLVEVEEEELLSAIHRVYGPEGVERERSVAMEISPIDPEAGPHDLEELANQPPVIRLVNLLLSQAVESGASDIHLSTSASGLQVHYRIDGVLEERPAPPPRYRPAIVSRLKIMAELDIAERRLPQDGRIRLKVSGRELDMRVSTLPTLHGESVVLRLLDAERQRHTLEGLGMADDTRAALLSAAARPQGVLLVTGPTGSGKTTTLYALVERIHTGREKVVSVEDPVEYELPGVAQVPVRSGAGLTFARALRSMLRQDPDILLVGEMRDTETAEICIQAAMTGHRVLSTLHTNDAPSAITRLLDLGVADYLVTSTVHAVLAQRLVRRICSDCARRAAPSVLAAREMGADGVELQDVMVGAGCGTCRGSGFRGRTGIYELLVVDEAMRLEVLARRGAQGLRTLALERGMRPLRTDGWRQVQAGLTTPEEVLRVTGTEERERKRRAPT